MPFSYLGYALVGGALFSNDHEAASHSHACREKSRGPGPSSEFEPGRFTLVGTKPFVERIARDYPRFASTHRAIVGLHFGNHPTPEHLQVLVTTFKDPNVADSFTVELHTATEECKNS